MSLDHETDRPPTTVPGKPAPFWLASPRALTGLVFASFFAACMPAAPEAEPNGGGTGGSKASGGSGGSKASGGSGGSSASGGSGGSSSGGNGSGSGGSGSGGSGSGGSGSGGSASGGGGGSSASGGAGGSTGSGGKVGTDAGGDAGKTDTKPDPNAPLPPDGTWANMKNAMSGCVFCHPGETGVAKNTDFGDMAMLHTLLLAPSKYISAACPIKMLVVPGKPLESLLYVKVAGVPPTGCGERMPKGLKPDQWNIDVIKNWIMAGAPAM